MLDGIAWASWPTYGPCVVLNTAARRYSMTPMRVVLALMAVLALLVSPVTAAAAQVACNQAGPAARASGDMPGMPGMDQAGAQKATANPCCNHSAKHPMDQKRCALACATSCAVAAALPTPLMGSVLVFSAAQLTPELLAPAHPYEPAGLVRPPRSMA